MYAFTTRRLALVSGLALALGFMGAGAAQADELDDITKAGVLKVGIFEDFPPFSSAGTDLKSQGYDIDVINALAKALNVTPELTGITGQNRIPSLTEHKLNLLVSVGVSDERKKVVAFTAPYAPYSIDVMGPKALAVKGPADLAGKSVAVNRGTLEDTSVTEVAPAGTDIQRFNDYNGVISAFLSGQVQLMVVGNDVGAAVLAKQPYDRTGIEIPASQFTLGHGHQQGRRPPAGQDRRGAGRDEEGRNARRHFEEVAVHSAAPGTLSPSWAMSSILEPCSNIWVCFSKARRSRLA